MTQEKTPEPEFDVVKAVILIVKSLLITRTGIVYFGSKVADNPTFWNITGLAICLAYLVYSFLAFIFGSQKDSKKKKSSGFFSR